MNMAAFSERLTTAVASHGALCVGLDPRFESLPRALKALPRAEAYEQFCFRVLELVRPFAGVIKAQSAFFEEAGPDGMKSLQAVMRRARELGFITILDAKRGDISSTAMAYANAAFDQFHADAVTINPWLGADAVEPFLDKARAVGGGVFVLVRTSNPGSGLFQNLIAEGRPIYLHVAEAIKRWNRAGEVGAVVGATQLSELKELRAALPGIWFLVPGYGAQGGRAEDVREAYPTAIVNSSRGVTFPFQPDDADWAQKIEAAARKAQAELRG